MDREFVGIIYLSVICAILFLVYITHVHASDVDIDWFDSRTQAGESYLLIDDCFVPVKTDKIHDLCYINKRIKKECGVDYKLGGKCG